jgi:DNA-binding transcriptional MerR regulator
MMNNMSNACATVNPGHAVQLFEPDPSAVYTIEAAERMAHMPRRLIALYCKHGLVPTVVDPDCGGFYFNDEAIRILRHIDYLRTVCGINLVVENVDELLAAALETPAHAGEPVNHCKAAAVAAH